MSTQVLAGVRVLCVDDNIDYLHLLRIVLEQNGADVTICRSAPEALVEIALAPFSVILSDLDMPGMDGYDLAHALRASERANGGHITPTMAISSRAADTTVKRRYADFQVYMTKPFNQEHLVHIVERLAEADGEAVKAGSLRNWEQSRAAT